MALQFGNLQAENFKPKNGHVVASNHILLVPHSLFQLHRYMKSRDIIETAGSSALQHNASLFAATSNIDPFTACSLRTNPSF